MRTFVNRQNKDLSVTCYDWTVAEGKDAYYLKTINISLPKREWKEIKTK